jgi:hypothetical protein
VNRPVQPWLQDELIILDEPAYSSSWRSSSSKDLVVGFDTNAMVITIKYRLIPLFGSATPDLVLYVLQQDVPGSMDYWPLIQPGTHLTVRGEGEVTLRFEASIGADGPAPNGLPIRLELDNGTAATRWAVQLSAWVQRSMFSV